MEQKSIPTEKGIQLKVANCVEDYEKVYQIRKVVFGQEQNYSEKCLRLGHSQNQQYILCLQNNQPVGTVTVELGEKNGDLDIDKYYNLAQYYSKYRRLLFWSRNAVIKEYRNGSIAPLLQMFMHKLVIEMDVGYVVVDCKTNNNVSKNMISRLGYNRIGNCIKGEIGPIIVWGLTLNNYSKNLRSYVEYKDMGKLFGKYFDLPLNHYLIPG